MSNGAAERAASGPPSSLHIDDLLANGQGVGRDRGLVFFVTGALPGEDVKVASDAVKRSYVSAHVTGIDRPSTDRVPSACPVFPRCGGCQTLHYRYAAQLTWKQRMVRDALERIGGFRGAPVAETVASEFLNETRYRNKASLVCTVRKNRAALGFYGARSHQLVAIDDCPVLLPWLDDAVRALAQIARNHPQILYDVRHLIVRTGLARESLVIGFSTHRPRADLEKFVPVLRNGVPHLTGIAATWDPSSENAIFGRRSATLWGSADTIERVLGQQFRFGLASFFQINTGILEKLAPALLDALQGAARIVDLYCGVGTFSILAAKRGIAVTGVESFAQAVDEAASNAAQNGVTNAAFECATTADALAGGRGRSLLDGADAAILDPPRRGCEPQELDALAAARVPRVMYLSCNPATLARDARRLADGGYRLQSATPFDMFPFTGHVEVLAAFSYRS